MVDCVVSEADADDEGDSGIAGGGVRMPDIFGGAEKTCADE